MNRIVLNHISRIAAVVAFTLSAWGQASTQTPGPFGFEKGMTREQIVKLVGELKPLPDSGSDIWEAKTAPKPHPAFESYHLVISPKDGLLKVVAVGKTVATGDSGSELRGTFRDLVAAVAQRYGKPSDEFDRCSGSDTECNNSEFWMMSLRNKNRTLASYWQVDNGVRNSVTMVAVEAHALRMNSGWVSVGFELDGFEKYADAKQNKQNTVF